MQLLVQLKERSRMTLCGFDWPAGRSKQVAYLDERYHIQEMFVKEGEFWQEHDLTAITHAPKASDMSPLAGFSWTAGGTKQIIYMDRNRHIQELHTGTHIWWQYTDLTALTNAPLVDGTALTGFEWTAGYTKQVVYVDHNYHIQEMHVGPGGQWQVVDLTALTGAPLAEGTHIVGYDWPAGRSKQVVYVDSNYHVQELYVKENDYWHCADLMAATGAPRIQKGPIAGFAWSAANTKEVVYAGPRNSIQELYVSPGGHWQAADLTLLTSLLILV